MSIDLNHLLETLRAEFKNRKVIPLSESELAVQTLNGFWLVVPSWNLDVAVGIIRDGQIEPWTNRIMLEHLSPGDKMVNVGANFGYYAALAAQRVGPEGEVHAVEANPVVFPYLVKSSFWSGFPNISRAYNFAAAGHANNDEKMIFAFDPQFIGGGNLFSRARTQVSYRENIWNDGNIESVLDENRKFIPRGLYSDVEVHGKSLDSIVSGDIDLILVDAEGAECFVVDGARNTIANSPNLKMILEWDPHSYRSGDETRRESIEAMWKFLLTEQNFSVFRIKPETYHSIKGTVELELLTPDQLYDIPHSDLLLRRD